jgi:penicillin-binding protein 1C
MQYGLPLAIGGADVTPMELAEGYATLARGCVHRQATCVLDSLADMGTTAPPPVRPALRPESCRAALYCLADPDRTEQACPSAVALSPAWKTGTSSGHRDAWCAAVTPRRTVVVWLGNADGTASDALVGQESAAPLALKILAATDPGGDGFAPPVDFRADAQMASAEISSDRTIAMISPVNGQEIVRDPSLPANQQRLSLRASGPADWRLWWIVDGQCLGQFASDQPLWWLPTPGEHEIRVVAENGRAASADIHIR